MFRKPAIGFALLVAALSTGCAARRPSTPTIADVSRSIDERSGHGLRETLDSTQPVPPGVNLDDTVTEEELIAAALWNNAGFQADLAALGFSRADVVEAGLLRNPVFSVLFPIGPKQLEATFNWPIEALWQRPRRLAAARLDASRAAENLVEHGLNLIRDARYAHAGATLAMDRLALAREHLELRRQILVITEARLRAGDISELEVLPVRNDVRAAEGELLQLERDLETAHTQIALIAGAILENRRLLVAASPLPAKSPPALDVLFTQAFASRPDMRASELAIEAAGERLRWQKSRVLAFTSILDANGAGREGFEIGPGLTAELFTADRNDAGRARAAAEMEQASRRYAGVRQQIGADPIQGAPLP